MGYAGGSSAFMVLYTVALYKTHLTLKYKTPRASMGFWAADLAMNPVSTLQPRFPSLYTEAKNTELGELS